MASTFMRHVDTAFVDWTPRGVLDVLDDFGRVAHGEIDDGRVMITGAIPGGGMAAFRRWAAVPLDPFGWAADEGQYVTGDQPRLTYRHPDGRRVDVYRAAAWFGEEASPETCRRAWAALRGLLGRRGWALLATPATTGRMALQATWDGADWPRVSDDVARLIRSTSGQGRFELGDAAAAGGYFLHRYDGRFMYGALAATELPVGEPVELGRRDAAACYSSDPYAPARWHVDFTVPRFWQHAGLVQATQPREWLRTPGAKGTAWVDGAELRLLSEHGWPFTLRAGLAFPDRARPLARFVGALRKMRDAWRPGELRALDAGDDVAEAVRDGLRAIALHTIGALHGRPHKITGTTAPELVPEDAVLVWDAPGGQLHWVREVEPPMGAFVHPEWSAHIWALARVRVLAGTKAQSGGGILSVPWGHYVGCALDAIYTSAAQPQIVDRGRDGDFRKTGEWGRWDPVANMPELYAVTA